MHALVMQLAEKLTKQNLTLVTAESCTAGGLAFALTEVPGSSNWFERGFVTYSNLSKEEMLGVKKTTLSNEGAVSEQTAREMAEGALKNSNAEISISITGVAGPDGGTAKKPVGMVWFAIAGMDKETQAFVEIFQGNRESVREQSINRALRGLLDFIK